MLDRIYLIAVALMPGFAKRIGTTASSPKRVLELVALKLRPDTGRIVGAEECHDVASFGLIDRREIVLDVPCYDAMLLVLIKERSDLALGEHLVEPPSVRSIGACKRQGEIILADE
jgi:hypothetical protein